MRQFCLVSTLALCLATPALADPIPGMVPTHDLTGTYLMNTSQGPRTMAVEYSAALRALRVTPQGGQGYILYDFTTHDAKMVMPQMQKYMDQPKLSAQARAVQGDRNGPPNNVIITTGDSTTIAGYGCTNTKFTNTKTGESSTLCITPDGVILQITSPNGHQITAQSISYSPVSQADVQLPAGYTQFVMPQMPPGMSLPGGMPMPNNMSMPNGAMGTPYGTPNPPPGQ